MSELRNAGFLSASFKAGDSISDYIYAEIRKRHPGWNACELHSLQLRAAEPFTFDLNGWTWTADNGGWFGSNVIIHDVVAKSDVTLEMAFRYDL